MTSRQWPRPSTADRARRSGGRRRPRPSTPCSDPFRLALRRPVDSALNACSTSTGSRACSTQGVYDFQPLRRDRWERLQGLRTGDDRELPLHLRREIERECKRLELVLEQIAATEAERDAAVAVPAADDADAAMVVQLAKPGGIGPELATVLVREALYRPFANRKEVAAYAGLTPHPYASGDRHRDQGISKAGNPLLRKAMVELAWLWLRYQPDSALARWFTERVGAVRGRMRKITAVALARKLLVALWRYVRTGLVPEGARLKVV